jgi:hypothetical protein
MLSSAEIRTGSPEDCGTLASRRAPRSTALRVKICRRAGRHHPATSVWTSACHSLAPIGPAHHRPAAIFAFTVVLAVVVARRVTCPYCGGGFCFPATFECTPDSAEARFGLRPRGHRESGWPHDLRGGDPRGRSRQRRLPAICRGTDATRRYSLRQVVRSRSVPWSRRRSRAVS